MDVSQVRTDLLDEQQALDDLVGDLADDQWSAPTPSPGWTVADQVAHLAYFDRAAALAIEDPEAFAELKQAFWEVAVQGAAATDDYALAPFRAMAPAGLVAAWRRDRSTLATASAGLADDGRVEWFGPSMGARSFLTARLMEVWAHGQDVVDALGLARQATDRLAHVARLGFITRSWSFVNRGLEAGDVAVRVRLDAPSGASWTYGDDDAPASVEGRAQDFCLVVTQRRHVDDTDLVLHGDAAREWMVHAQAFAGPPSDGPPAGTWR